MKQERKWIEQVQPGVEGEEERDDVDLILRHVSRQFPEALARALVATGDRVEVGDWIDTQVSGRQRRLDRALEVTLGGLRGLLHVEWQLQMTAEVPFRVYEYNVLLSLGQADGARAGAAPLPIDRERGGAPCGT